MPACVCTSYDPAASQFDALRAIACGIIEKPFDEQRLTNTVQAAMAGMRDLVAALW